MRDRLLVAIAIMLYACVGIAGLCILVRMPHWPWLMFWGFFVLLFTAALSAVAGIAWRHTDPERG